MVVLTLRYGQKGGDEAGSGGQKTLTTTEIWRGRALIPSAFGGRNLNPRVIKRAEFYEA
jgi:hypothetical protein